MFETENLSIGAVVSRDFADQDCAAAPTDTTTSPYVIPTINGFSILSLVYSLGVL